MIYNIIIIMDGNSRRIAMHTLSGWMLCESRKPVIIISTHCLELSSRRVNGII